MAKVFGNWEVGECIGEGAFGKVYKITKEDFGEVYNAALKVIEIPANQSEVESVRNEGMNDESVTEYFNSIVKDVVAEFALMSKLKGHSNIVSYEDHSVIPNENKFGWTIYIRMELLTPLYTYIKEHPLTVRDVIQLGIDICSALKVCQKYNIIHRDIKPENIFVSDIGSFKLGDFGIARQLEKTSSGLSKKGTYSYMAPEVYKGLEYNSTVDLYSLGIVLYRFMNGNRLPFMPMPPEPIKYSDKEKANLLRMSGQALPKPCSAEGRMAEIILKACSYNPKERYESAFDMCQALQNVLYSKHEGEIIYPYGDTLENSRNEYLTGSNQYKGELAKGESIKNEFAENNLYNSNVDDGTIYVNADINRTVESNVEETAVLVGSKEDNRKDVEFSDNREESIENVAFSENREGVIENVELLDSKNDVGETAVLESQSGRNDLKNNHITDEIESKVNVGDNKKSNLFPLFASLLIGTVIIASLIFILILKSDRNEDISADNSAGTSEINMTDSDNSDEAVSDNKVGGIEIDNEKINDATDVENKLEETDVSQKVLTPDLGNLSKSDAIKSLEKVSLGYQIKEEYSDKIKKGMVISQNPKSGAEIDAGSDVDIVISKGEEKVSVPSAVGISLEKAKSKLKNNNLKYKIKREYSSNVAKGKVISQSVKSGAKVKKNKVIKLVVSKGKKPTPVVYTPTPSYSGESSSSGSTSGGSSSSGSSSGSTSGGSSNSGSSSGSTSGGSSSSGSSSNSSGSSKKPSSDSSSKSDWVIDWD